MKTLKPERLPRRCACGKLLCRSIEHARHIHAIIWAAKGGEDLVRFYECDQGAWHWTRDLNPEHYQQQTKAAA